MEGSLVTVQSLALQAGVPLRSVAGLSLMSQDGARTLLEVCASEGVRVLGLEGFTVDGDEVRPAMGAIADLSAVEDAARSVEEAKRFLDTVSPRELHYEITVDQRGDAST